MSLILLPHPLHILAAPRIVAAAGLWTGGRLSDLLTNSNLPETNMKGRNTLAVVTALGLGVSMLVPTTAQAFDAGGFAGGILGGMIGSAIAQGARPQRVIVVRPRPVYRVVVPRRVVVERHYAAAPHPSHVAAPKASNAAVVNPAADPFASAKPTGPTPLPVANKP